MAGLDPAIYVFLLEWRQERRCPGRPARRRASRFCPGMTKKRERQHMTTKLFDLKGKVAIVTGGNGGIGLGMARGLADAGADIAVVGRNETKSEAAMEDLRQRGVKAIAIEADVTDKAAVAAMTEKVASEF